MASKRKSYSATFKLEAIEFAEMNSNEKAAKKGVSVGSIYR
jgi:hypothetical protein